MELVEAGKYLSRESAEICRGLLESSGIPAIVMTDDAGGLRPHMAYVSSGSIRLMVAQANLQEALAILAEENHEDLDHYWNEHQSQGEPAEPAIITLGHRTYLKRAIWATLIGLIIIPVIGQVFSIYLLSVILPARSEFKSSEKIVFATTFVTNVITLLLQVRLYLSL